MLANETLNATHISVQLQAQCKLDVLQLSYILYSPMQFSSHHNAIELITAQAITYLSLQQSAVSSLATYIYGITGFSGAAVPSSTFKLSIQIDDIFLVEVKSESVARGRISLVFFSRKPSQVCEACLGKLPFYSSACQDKCTDQQACINYTDGTQGCGVCHELANFVLQNKKCECKPGYVLSNFSCIASQLVPESAVQTQNFIDGMSDDQTSVSAKTLIGGLIEVKKRNEKVPLKPIFGVLPKP